MQCVCVDSVELCLPLFCSQAKVSSLEEELKETETAFQRAQDQVEQLVCVCAVAAV